MPNAKSVMSLNYYAVKSMNFKVNEDFEPKNIKNVMIAPEFSRAIGTIDKDNFAVKLTVNICSTNESPLPYNVSATVEGSFHLKDWENPKNISMAKLSAPTILFPYLRSVVKMITSDSVLPPYNLPIVNIANLFKEEQ